MSPLTNEQTRQLCRALLTLKTEEDCLLFLEDVCTMNEVLDLSQRLAVAKNLIEGKTFAAISAETGASTATISRVNKCVMYGTGAYKKVFSRLNEEGN